MPQLRTPNIFGNYLAGRQSVQDERQMQMRNSLAMRDQALQEENAATNRNYLAEQTKNLQRDDERAGRDAQQKAEKEWLSNGISAARQNPSLIPQLIAEAKHRQYIPAEIPDDLGPDGLEQIALKIGMAPAPLPFDQSPEGQRYKVEQEGRLEVAREQGRQSRLTAASKPSEPKTQYVPLTPAEIQAIGLPPGSSAQKDVTTGKIDILGRRDTTGVLSQKDATAAKIKLNTLALARKQIANIREKFAGKADAKGVRTGGVKGTLQAGFGQGWVPGEQGKAFDKAVDMVRGTLTSLTRTPGVGAMSDYETKLDQAKFPQRGEYESVTEDNINQLDDMLTLIENGYRDLLSGNAPQASAPAASASGPLKVKSPQEAMALPSGTRFITPDGREKVRP